MPRSPTRATRWPLGGSRRAALRQSAPLFALLALGLILTGGVVALGWAALRGQTVALDDVRRGYAALAAQRYASRVEIELYNGAMAILRSVGAGRLGDPPVGLLPERLLAAAESTAACRCAPVLTPAFTFARRAGGSQPVMIGMPSAPDAVTRRWLDGAIAERLGSLAEEGGWDFALLPELTPQTGFAVFVGTFGAPDRLASVVYGFATDTATLRRQILGNVLATTPLLEVGRGIRSVNDSAVIVTVTTATGTVLLGRSADLRESDAAVQVAPPFGSLRIGVTLTPWAIARLGRGSRRVPRGLLGALFGGTALMLGAASVLAYRTTALARARHDFMSSMSHELRTPLTQILLYAETLELERARSDAERRRAASVIVREATRLLHMVETVLHLARAERLQLAVAPRYQPIGPVVDEVVGTFIPLAEGRQMTLTAACPPNLWAVIDAHALRHILLNYLDNAVRYGPDGQRIAVGAARLGAAVQVWVDDEGPGIPPDRTAEIWKPFVRLDHGGGATGTGIGLAVVRELAELSRAEYGVARVATPVGERTRFFVKLPAAGPSAEDAPTIPGAEGHARD